MHVCFDIETNSLTNPDKIWCIVARDVSTKEEYVFTDMGEFLKFFPKVTKWIGHNVTDYDCKWLTELLGVVFDKASVVDTLVLSHLLKYKLEEGHSLEAWGDRLGVAKVGLDIDFSTYAPEIVERCKRDVEINLKLYEFLMSKLDRKEFTAAIQTEMEFAWICREMHENGFCFDIDGAKQLYNEIEEEVKELDAQIKAAFPPKAKFIREYTPRLTQHGTISRTSVPGVLTDLSNFSAGSSFSFVKWEDFNPGSTRQVIERLEGHWEPVDRTDGYLRAVKERNKEKLKKIDKTAWKLNETNLSTLRETAPVAAQFLVRRMMLDSRLRTLTEWMENASIDVSLDDAKKILETITSTEINEEQSSENGTHEIKSSRESIDERTTGKRNANTSQESTSESTASLLSRLTVSLKNRVGAVLSALERGSTQTSIITIPLEEFEEFSALGVTSHTNGSCRIRGKFSGIGTWTHRMSHRQPNMGNIATAKSIKYNSPELKKRATELGGRMRSLWVASPGAILVGCDMESAHLRIFAHLIDDNNFKEALLKGDKKLGTDPHSTNQRILGDVCADRDRAKTFIFTFLNGGGAAKVSSIFGTTISRAKEAISRFIEGYQGLKSFKEKDARNWAKRGYFIGPDGRFVVNESDHHMLAGYLQNYEATLMKKANLIWRQDADKLGIKYKQVNMVHDEFVTEVYGTEDDAHTMGKLQASAIRMAGEIYGMRIPMDGTYQIGRTWLDVH